MRIFGGLAVLGLMATGLSPVLAQSASDFRLPEPGASPSARPQGPVDADNPILVLPRASASATPSPSPAPIATPALPVEEGQAPAATAPRGAARPAARPAGTAPATGTLPAPVPAASEAAPGPFGFPATTSADAPAGAATPSLSLPPADLAPTASENGSAWWWPYVAGAAGLLAALFAFLLLRRRRTAEPVVAFEPPVIDQIPEPMPAPQPAPAPTRLIDSLPEPALSAPPPAPVVAVPGIAVALEARRMNASLMATTLSYRLVLTNTGPEPLSALAIEGDMIAAHATLPQEQQVVQPAQRLELRHALSTLAPGESAEFSGDIRLPLTAITPIRAGEAALFIPLARFRIEAGEPNGRPLVVAQTFVVGEEPQASGGGLRPFRLDLGPRTYSRLSQRLVN